ncbi:type IIL restriction-modification enzyme MmeI [Humibacter ginsengiterrae]
MSGSTAQRGDVYNVARDATLESDRKATLNLKSVEERVRPLGGRGSYDREFIFELLAAYGRSSSNITRLRNGSLNVADDRATEVAQKNVVYFKEATDDLYAVVDDLRSAPTVARYSTRFVIVTDYREPSEWYSVPLHVIDQAIELIASDDIVDFEYDAEARQLRMR